MVAVCLLLAGMAGYFWVYPWVEARMDDGDVGLDGGGDGGGDRPEALTYDIGSGSDDWWTAYPLQSPYAGGTVPHLDWVVDEAVRKPVLLFIHSTTCVPCADQAEYIAEALPSLDADIGFHDILADGTNPLAYDAFDVYDSNGDPNYIPLTVIVTYIMSDGGPVLAWHSVEGSTSVQWLVSYLSDALVYYE